MKKSKFFFLFSALILSATLLSANVDSVFLKMPTKMIALLDGKARFEMLEYFKAGQADSVRNKLGGYSRVLYRNTLTNHIVFQSAINSKYDMKLFKTSDSTYITGIIHTTGERVLLSKINFYDSEWKLLNIVLPEISAGEWYQSWSGKAKLMPDDALVKMLSDNFLAMSFDKTDTLIRVRNYSAGLLSNEDKKKILEFTGNKQTELTDILFRLHSFHLSPFVEKVEIKY
ncbi:MAG: DUF3256 family protein [Paludibacteraceae bacterium]|nr:DUF3256 family protein [Paludibacteraceae bacterium]